MMTCYRNMVYIYMYMQKEKSVCENARDADSTSCCAHKCRPSARFCAFGQTLPCASLHCSLTNNTAHCEPAFFLLGPFSNDNCIRTRSRTRRRACAASILACFRRTALVSVRCRSHPERQLDKSRCLVGCRNGVRTASRRHSSRSRHDSSPATRLESLDEEVGACRAICVRTGGRWGHLEPFVVY